MKRNRYYILMVLFILAACVPPQEVDQAATATQEATATTEPTSTSDTSVTSLSVG